MPRRRNTQGGQFHKPSDGSRPDGGDGGRVRQKVRRMRGEQDTHGRGERNRPGDNDRLPDAAAGGVRQEEKAQHHGEHADNHRPLLHQEQGL